MNIILSVDETKKREAELMAQGAGETELTLRAARGVLALLPAAKKPCIVIGGGNNGGDGVCLGKLLKEQNILPTFVFACEKLSNTSQYFLKVCDGIANNRAIDGFFDFSGFDLIIDCLLGTGFKGKLSVGYKNLIERINASGKPVVSVDIPSGLDGDSGLAEIAVKCDLCVCIGALKAGAVLNQAKDYIKETAVADIGFKNTGDCFLVRAKDFKGALPARLNFSNKGSYGTAGILAGSLNYSGAAKLANISLSALRSGAGVSRLIVPDSIGNAVIPYILESTLATLPSDESGGVRFDEKAVYSAIKGLNSLAFGMGMGGGEGVGDTLKYILENGKTNLIIDADGINALSKGNLGELKSTECRVALTPHVKEFSRLTALETDEIIRNPIYCAKRFAERFNIIILLKGTSTVISDGKTTLVVSAGAAGMATAGSGDVLSGICAGLAAHLGLSVKTVALAALINGTAGELADREMGSVSAVASDTVAKIPEAVKSICG